MESITCSPLYIPPTLENHGGILLVTGIDRRVSKYTMEYLIINNDFRKNKWRVCDDNLPCSVIEPQIYLIQNKIILMGDNETIPHVNRRPSHKVWQGIISFNRLRINKFRVNWSRLPSMMERRHYHVTVVIGDKLFCIGGIGKKSGGIGKKSTEYFSFGTNQWQKGPELPFSLYGAKGVLNKEHTQCFLLGGNLDGECSENITLFDPIKGVINVEGTLDIPRCKHIAVLL